MKARSMLILLLVGLCLLIFQTAAPAAVVATPTFSPEGGAYTSAQYVTVRCATTGATIRYTTNGMTPTEISPALSNGGMIKISQSTTLKARAWKYGMTASETRTAQYTIGASTWVATPNFSPTGGSYSGAVNVVVRCATAGATIHYTTNGAIPTESSPTVANEGTIRVEKTLVLKAKAWKTGMAASETQSASYTISASSGIVATPTLTPDGGTYTEARNVVVRCAIVGAVIRYTTDGTTPTETSAVIANEGIIRVDRSMTVKAKAWKQGMNPSETKTAQYVINISGGTVATPTFTPDGGTYSEAKNVVVRCATTDAVIRYTIDGTTPTEVSPAIPNEGIVQVTKSLVLKARAWKTGMTASAVKTAQYTITPSSSYVATPTFTPDGGSYTEAKSVVVRCATVGATIRYTIDGTTPTESSPIVANEGTVRVEKSLMLKAKAWKTGMLPSAIKSAEYNISISSGTVATPTLTPDAGSYTEARNVIVRCSTVGATIRYTTDGTTPTESSLTVANEGTIRVEKSLVLKVKAWKTGMTASAVKTAQYTITPSTSYVAKPTFTPDGGTYSTTQNVVIRCATAGAIIRYTTNGTTPTETSATIANEGTVRVEKSLVLKAKAWKTGMTASEVKIGEYKIGTASVAVPTFTPDGGTYSTAQRVVVRCATTDAVIRYTTNGETPTEVSPVIANEGTVWVEKSLTLKAKAFKVGMTPSETKSASYTITSSTVATPTFSPDGGYYPNPIGVVIRCETSGAIIRYTTNGETPTERSAVITSGSTLLVGRTMTLKAKAWKSGSTASNVKSSTYTIGANGTRWW